MSPVPVSQEEKLMKVLVRILGVAALVALAVVIFRAIRQYREDSVFDLAPAPASGDGQRRSISPNC